MRPFCAADQSAVKPSTATKHSDRLAKIPQKNTGIERTVRSILNSWGLRFRLNNRDLPGSPDLANRTKQWAVFVNGCYWHHHENCRRATTPKTNRSFWLQKFRDNRARDSRVTRELGDMGYTCCTIWECEVKDDPSVARAKLQDFAQSIQEKHSASERDRAGR